MSDAVRAAQAAEADAYALLVEARRGLHMHLSARIRQGDRVPREVADLVAAADRALAAYSKAVAATGTAARDAVRTLQDAPD